MNAFEIAQLSELIERKGWSSFDGTLRRRGDTVSGLLVTFLERMASPQRALAMDLLSDYLILKDYTLPAIDLLDRICAATSGSLKIAPVKTRRAGRIKSGDALVYEMDAHQMSIEERILKFHDDPFEAEFWEGSEKKILVDDFIGSGDQIFEMIDEISKSGIAPRIDTVATIVMQEPGQKRLLDHGINVITIYARPKALTYLASTSGKDEGELRAIYLEIEKHTGCSPFESFGYQNTEATVTMKKTPDNTLPIFWYEGDAGWPAPFPRKQ
jgi:hypothetical protein